MEGGWATRGWRIEDKEWNSEGGFVFAEATALQGERLELLLEGIGGTVGTRANFGGGRRA